MTENIIHMGITTVEEVLLWRNSEGLEMTKGESDASSILVWQFSPSLLHQNILPIEADINIIIIVLISVVPSFNVDGS